MRQFAIRMIDGVLSIPILFELQQRFFNNYENARREFEDYITESGAKILDIGCSTGAGGAQIFDFERHDYTGVDVEPRYVEAAARRYPGGTYLQMDARSLSFEDNSIDLVLFLGVIHHMNDLLARDCIKDVRRVLKPSGKVLVAEPVFTPGKPLSNILLSLDRGRFIRDQAGYRDLLEGLQIERERFFPLSAHRFCSFVAGKLT